VLRTPTIGRKRFAPHGNLHPGRLSVLPTYAIAKPPTLLSKLDTGCGIKKGARIRGPGAGGAVSFQRSAISFWLSVISGQFSVCRNSARTLIAGRRSSFILHSLPAPESSFQLQRSSGVALQLNPNRKRSP
jgi:hypothetical protein